MSTITTTPATTTANLTDAPHAWVGCLACYNAGHLTGEWVAASDAEDFAPCTRSGHDEFWVMDHENFGGLLCGECSPADAQDLAAVMGDLEGRGIPVGAAAAWMARAGVGSGELRDYLDELGDAYQGEHDGLTGWGCSYLEDAGALAELPGWAEGYAYTLAESWARDQMLSGEVWTAPTGGGAVWVFSAR